MASGKKPAFGESLTWHGRVPSSWRQPGSLASEFSPAMVGNRFDTMMASSPIHANRNSSIDQGASVHARAPQLLPYCGDRDAEHRATTGAAGALRTYASDKSGTKTYRFNSGGYRGEELNPDAAMRVFICGASYAFGTGLDWEETWGHQLKLAIATGRGLEPQRVNLLNFSQSLASANYVTRTLMSQCDAVRPDLVVANYSDMERGEYFLDGRPVGLMPYPFPWHRRWRALRPGWKRRLFRLLPGLSGRAAAATRLKMWHHYSQLFSRETAFVNTLMSILLLQSFCRARGIECLISWIQHRSLSDPRFADNPAIGPLINLVDRSSFCPFSIIDDDIGRDLAADGIHPGPESNLRFAGRLADLYLGRLAGAPSVA